MSQDPTPRQAADDSDDLVRARLEEYQEAERDLESAAHQQSPAFAVHSLDDDTRTHGLNDETDAVLTATGELLHVEEPADEEGSAGSLG